MLPRLEKNPINTHLEGFHDLKSITNYISPNFRVTFKGADKIEILKFIQVPNPFSSRPLFFWNFIFLPEMNARIMQLIKCFDYFVAQTEGEKDNGPQGLTQTWLLGLDPALTWIWPGFRRKLDKNILIKIFSVSA